MRDCEDSCEEVRFGMKILIVDDEFMAMEEAKFVVKKVIPDAEIICADNYIDVFKIVEETKIDVAFLDIEMPGIDGLIMAKCLQEKYEDINIIFTTAYSQYALDAFQLYASGYLLKPLIKEHVEMALHNLRYKLKEEKLEVKCFGKFEVFYKGQPVSFKRAKAKEILAYLVNLQGASANTAELCAVLWEEQEDEEKNKHYLRNLIADLRATLRACEAEEIFISKRNQFSIDVTKVQCDYFDYMDRKESALSSFNGEYMSQYSWAEVTLGRLEKIRV